MTIKRVVFNIHGNSSPLITGIEYRLKIEFVVWFATHSQYDKIDAKNNKKIISNIKIHRHVLIHSYKKIKPDSKAADGPEILSILVKEYQNEHYPVSRPDHTEAIKFRLHQMNISEVKLSEMFGHRSPKSEILSGKRKLNLVIIRKLTENLRIPAEVLIQAY